MNPLPSIDGSNTQPLAVDYAGPRKPIERRHASSWYVSQVGGYVFVAAVVFRALSPPFGHSGSWRDDPIGIVGSSAVLGVAVVYLWLRTFEGARPTARRRRVIASAACATVTLLAVVGQLLAWGRDPGYPRSPYRPARLGPTAVAVAAAITFAVVNRGAKRPPPAR